MITPYISPSIALQDNLTAITLVVIIYSVIIVRCTIVINVRCTTNHLILCKKIMQCLKPWNRYVLACSVSEQTIGTTIVNYLIIIITKQNFQKCEYTHFLIGFWWLAMCKWHRLLVRRVLIHWDS